MACAHHIIPIHTIPLESIMIASFFTLYSHALLMGALMTLLIVGTFYIGLLIYEEEKASRGYVPLYKCRAYLRNKSYRWDIVRKVLFVLGCMVYATTVAISLLT